MAGRASYSGDQHWSLHLPSNLFPPLSTYTVHWHMMIVVLLKRGQERNVCNWDKQIMLLVVVVGWSVGFCFVDDEDGVVGCGVDGSENGGDGGRCGRPSSSSLLLQGGVVVGGGVRVTKFQLLKLSIKKVGCQLLCYIQYRTTFCQSSWSCILFTK